MIPWLLTSKFKQQTNNLQQTRKLAFQRKTLWTKLDQRIK